MPAVHPTPRAASAKATRAPWALYPAEPIWTLRLNNQLTAPPAYDATHAFFPIEGDRLVAYNLLSGTQAWMAPARAVLAPVAGGGFLFLVERSVLTALRVADGAVAWRVPFDEALAVPPVWDNGWLIVASARGEVGAFRGTDGQLIWRRDLESPAHGQPALASDGVYVPTTDGRVVALRVADGTPLWERSLGGTPGDIVATADRLYVGSSNRFFWCLMMEDGRIAWRWRTGGDVVGPAVVDDTRVYFAALDNVLRALDRKSGNQHWMRPLPMRPAWGPVLAGATIVVAGQSPTLRAVNVKDGMLAGSIVPGAPAPKPPAAPLGAARTAGSAAADAAQPLDPALLPKVLDPGGTQIGPGAALVPGRVLPLEAAGMVPVEPTEEASARPYALIDPVTRLPMLVIVARDIAKGASVTLVRTTVEPAITPVAALPNLIMIAPPTSPAAK